MRIAHISDLHVLSLVGVRWYRFLSKRIIGAVNLASFRANAHPTKIFDALITDLAMQNLDHIVITGDVSNLALESEFERALMSLLTLGGPDRWTIIPGNHDAYTYHAAKSLRFEKIFAPWLGWRNPDSPPYPVIKQLNDVVIYGLSSAIPSPPFFAWGTVDKTQLKRLQDHASTTEAKHMFKIVLIHHNLHIRGNWSDLTAQLRNKRAVIDTIFNINTDIVLHGHTHKAHRYLLEKQGKTIPVVGSGSSTWVDPRHPARYNIITISNDAIERIDCRILNLMSQQFEDYPSPLAMDADGIQHIPA